MNYDKWLSKNDTKNIVMLKIKLEKALEGIKSVSEILGTIESDEISDMNFEKELKEIETELILLQKKIKTKQEATNGRK